MPGARVLPPVLVGLGLLGAWQLVCSMDWIDQDTPTPLETIVPAYLWRHRRGGRFSSALPG